MSKGHRGTHRNRNRSFRRISLLDDFGGHDQSQIAAAGNNDGGGITDSVILSGISSVASFASDFS